MTNGELIRSCITDDESLARYCVLIGEHGVVNFITTRTHPSLEWWIEFLKREVVDDDENESPETGAGSD